MGKLRRELADALRGYGRAFSEHLNGAERLEVTKPTLDAAREALISVIEKLMVEMGEATRHSLGAIGPDTLRWDGTHTGIAHRLLYEDENGRDNR